MSHTTQTAASKVAAITGAAQGIGRRTAELLAARGYAIAIIDLHPATDTIAAIESAGGQVFTYPADITSESAVQQFAAKTLATYGRIDTLVNNAGISHICPAESIPADAYRRVLEVNLVAPFLLAKAFARAMLAQHSGSIINVASIAGLHGIADRAAYNASKHGLIGLTRTLAAEWGGRGIRVNAVCPGWVKTEMDIADQASGSYTDADITDRIPMARFATPDDIAHAIAFLADSKESAFINGHTLTVDGGWTSDATWQSLRLSKR